MARWHIWIGDCTVGGGGVDTRSSHYQELKSRIHQDLLNRLDLERLTRMRREEAEPEIRNLIVGDGRARERGACRSACSSARR